MRLKMVGKVERIDTNLGADGAPGPQSVLTLRLFATAATKPRDRFALAEVGLSLSKLDDADAQEGNLPAQQRVKLIVPTEEAQGISIGEDVRFFAFTPDSVSAPESCRDCGASR